MPLESALCARHEPEPCDMRRQSKGDTSPNLAPWAPDRSEEFRAGCAPNLAQL